MLNAAAVPFRQYPSCRAFASGLEAMEDGMAVLTRRALIGLGVSGGALAAGGLSAPFYMSALRRARARLAAYDSSVVTTRFGDLEYAVAGSGYPVLMIHGSGGGFDQGLLFTEPLSKRKYKVIAPSRFGYLRSSFPADPSPWNQADAFAELLDSLGLDKVAVIGASAGALSALAFAIRYPERCSALLPIVPAAYAPGRPPARPWSAAGTLFAEAVLRSDFLFWAASMLAPNTMIRTLLAADPALLDSASQAERDRIEAILQAILPVSDRANGLLADMRFAGSPEPMPLETITAPTLTISFEDDLYLTADAARHIASTVAGAESIIYPSGGHVGIGRNDEMFGEIDRFIGKSVGTKIEIGG